MNVEQDKVDDTSRNCMLSGANEISCWSRRRGFNVRVYILTTSYCVMHTCHMVIDKQTTKFIGFFFVRFICYSIINKYR